MMPGMIMLWHGTIATIPSGWALCDGNNGTPDLRNRFICCAQEDEDGLPKAILRAAGVLMNEWVTRTHNHSFTGDGHAHDLASGDKIPSAEPTGLWDHVTTVSPATGDTASQYSAPATKVLAYIMKLPLP